MSLSIASQDRSPFQQLQYTLSHSNFSLSKRLCPIVESNNFIGSGRPEFFFCLASEITQDRQCTYNVTLRSVHATTVTVEKLLLHILSVFL